MVFSCVISLYIEKKSFLTIFSQIAVTATTGDFVHENPMKKNVCSVKSEVFIGGTNEILFS